VIKKKKRNRITRSLFYSRSVFFEIISDFKHIKHICYIYMYTKVTADYMCAK